MSKLYIIATPIGNLEEISFRTLNVIKNVDYIAAEDTRISSKILLKYEIKKKLISCHEHNEKNASDKIIGLLKNNKSVAYMCDAGTPCISDPGKLLVQKCVCNNIDIVPVSGPSALINVAVASGFSIEHFYFYGFLSSKQTERKKELAKFLEIEEPIIFYEAPHRIKKTLNDILSVLGNRNICIGREMTKIHEEFIRGSVEEVISLFQEKNPKGEFSIIIEGIKKKFAKIEEVNKDQTVKEKIIYFIKRGDSGKKAIQKTSVLCDVPKNKVYKIYLDIKKEKLF